jgi:hypothetical protein
MKLSSGVTGQPFTYALTGKLTMMFGCGFIITPSGQSDFMVVEKSQRC